MNGELTAEDLKAIAELKKHPLMIGGTPLTLGDLEADDFKLLDYHKKSQLLKKVNSPASGEPDGMPSVEDIYLKGPGKK